MSQSDFGTIDASTKTGTQLATDLNDWRTALHSLHSGASRPSYVAAGMLWIKIVSGSSWELSLYDGDADVVIANIDPSADTYTVPDGSVATASIAALAVTTAKLAVNAVTTAKITNANVTAAKLATDAVETAKIKDDNVTNAKLTSEALATLGALSIVAGDIVYGSGTDAISRLAKGTDGEVLTLSSGVPAWAAAAGGAFENELLHVQDQQTAGTDGGTFTQGDWRTRDLNTAVTNEITGASLATNQITLPTWTYWIEAQSTAVSVTGHKLRFQNVTDASTTLIGMASYAGGTVDNDTAHLFGRFTIAAEKDFELQHRCQSTESTIGFGSAIDFSVIEIYSDVRIWKVA